MDELLPLPQFESAIRAADLGLADCRLFGRRLDPIGTEDPARAGEPVKAVRRH